MVIFMGYVSFREGKSFQLRCFNQLTQYMDPLDQKKHAYLGKL